MENLAKHGLLFKSTELGIIKDIKRTIVYEVFFTSGLVRSIVDTKITESFDDCGLKQWQCMECGFARKKKSVVVYHIEYKHMNQNLPCSHCGKMFSNEHALKKHVKSSHLQQSTSYF